MDLKFNNKKWMWTSNKWITSWMFEFEYENIESINSLPDLFKVEVWEQIFSATINSDSPAPIVIDTNKISYKCKRWEWKTWLDWVTKCQVKLDIFIDDLLCWIIRSEILTIK